MDFSNIDYWRRPVSPEIRAWSDAVNGGDAVACRKVLDAGLDVNTATERGFPALIEAIRDGHEEVVRLLLDRGANPNVVDKFTWPALLYAARSSKSGMYLRLLVGAGVNPSFSPPNAPGTYLTPFQTLVKSGHASAVRFLMEECGEEPSQRTRKGRTLMQLASQSDSLKEYLRSLKTEASIRDAMTDENAASAAPARAYRERGIHGRG